MQAGQRALPKLGTAVGFHVPAHTFVDAGEHGVTATHGFLLRQRCGCSDSSASSTSSVYRISPTELPLVAEVREVIRSSRPVSACNHRSAVIVPCVPPRR